MRRERHRSRAESKIRPRITVCGGRYGGKARRSSDILLRSLGLSRGRNAARSQCGVTKLRSCVQTGIADY
jgi:hypothetical protein